MASIELIKASDGTGNAEVPTVQTTRAPGATTIDVDTVQGINTAGFMASMGTPHTFVDPITAETITVISEATCVDFAGHVDGSNLEIDTIAPGQTDLGSAAGDIIIIRPTTQWSDNVASTIGVSHEDDGTIKTDAISSETMFTDNVDPVKRDDETTFDFVASGAVWTGDSYGSTRAASMTAGVFYINGQRGTIAAVTARTFTASKDTYIDVLNTSGVFTLVYTEVSNNAASPALAANSIRIGIIVTGASNIANAGSVNQGEQNKVLPIASSVAYSVTDSLGNLICPRDPQRRLLGYKQITANDTNTGAISVTTGLTCPVIVPTGRKVRVTAWAQDIAGSTSPFDVSLAVYDGTVAAGTRLAVGAGTIPTNNYIAHVTASALTTPTTSSKTYEAGHTSSGGNGILHASATSPAYIMVELV